VDLRLQDEIFAHTEDVATWHAAAKGEKVDWAALYKNYNSTLDTPGNCCWRELLEAFPDALLLHSKLKPERWYESTLETVYTTSTQYPLLHQLFVPWTRLWTDMLNIFVWQGVFGGRFLDKEYAISVYNQREKDVSH
jgi:Sulfotransferase domain